MAVQVKIGEPQAATWPPNPNNTGPRDHYEFLGAKRATATARKFIEIWETHPLDTVEVE